MSLSVTSTAFLTWLVTTKRGDVAELVSASGEPFAWFRYDAYGTVTASGVRAVSGIPTSTAQAIADAIRLRYAGCVYDAESGYYYLSARYYHPAACHFTTKDPTLADGAANPCGYCTGDPIGSSDRSGLIVGLDHDGRMSGARRHTTPRWMRRPRGDVSTSGSSGIASLPQDALSTTNGQRRTPREAHNPMLRLPPLLT